MAQRFDVIVVGAGSAGSVLASRLSERPTRTVLLLEEGPGWPAPPAIGGPSFHDALAEPGWSYPNVMATFTPGGAAKQYLRGRGLGGSSAVNAMVAIPGIPDDYDEWERLGATGWGWADMMPWFARTRLTMRPADDHEPGRLSRAVLAALPHNSSRPPLTRNAAGRRVSAADAYLAHAVDRPNLTIRSDSAVDRLLVDVDQRTVSGVRLIGGEEFEAAEVIVSCGAIHSPQLLLRSGIDTPGVGEGLREHASVPVPIMLGNPESPDSLPISVIARMSSGEEPADLQLLPNDHIGRGRPEVGMVLVGLMKVHSVGTVTEQSIDFNLLSDERDVRRMRRGLELADRLTQHPAVAELGECLVPNAASDSELRALTGDYVHATGTCAIGRVVDPLCRVRGYRGLRVCDASVMPDLPRANTHLTTVVIAERVAAMIDASASA